MTVPGSFAVGDVLTAADMNEFGAWTSFTPTVGGVTTSAKTGKYYKMQKLGFVYVSLTLSAAPTAAVTVDWPSGFTPANTTSSDPRNVGNYFDTSAAAAVQNYPIYMRNTATNWRFAYMVVTGAAVNTQDLTNTNYPVLPANGDIISAFWVGEVT